MALNDADKPTILAALQAAFAKMQAIIAEAEAAKAELYKIVRDIQD